MPTPLGPAWICPICGYVHYGPEPPEECPVCGAARHMFERYAQAAPADGAAAPCPAEKFVIAGAGIAGVSAAEALRKCAPQASITLLTGEPHLPYYRLNLTRYLAGEVTADQLTLFPESWYAENHIDLVRSTRLQALDLDKRDVTLTDGRHLAYDKLILTVGASPFRPPFPGGGLANVTTLRTCDDADLILAAGAGGKRCVCIGAGPLGLETAGALTRRGAHVTVLENQPWLLPRQLTAAAGLRLQKHIASLGIELRTRAVTQAVVGDKRVKGVQLEDGSLIPADVVVLSAGVRSNVMLARQAGLEAKQGIVVDDQMRTSHPSVWAAGDVAEHRDLLYGLWNPARLQGSIAGMTAGGQTAAFPGVPRSVTLKVLGIEMVSLGQIAPAGASDRWVEGDDDKGRYFAFLFRQGRLAGAIVLGDATLAPKAKQAVEEAPDCAALLREAPTVNDIVQYLEALEPSGGS